MSLDIMELLRTASYHKGMAEGIAYAVDEIVKQIARQGAESEKEMDETSTVPQV